MCKWNKNKKPGNALEKLFEATKAEEGEEEGFSPGR
jgi:hypothetical protein